MLPPNEMKKITRDVKPKLNCIVFYRIKDYIPMNKYEKYWK